MVIGCFKNKFGELTIQFFMCWGDTELLYKEKPTLTVDSLLEHIFKKMTGRWEGRVSI